MPGKSVPAGWSLLSAGLIAALAMTLVAAPAEASPGITTRVSLTSAGEELDLGGFDSALSTDGNVVAFSSNATNLGAGSAQECASQDGTPYRCSQVFARNLDTGITELVSLSESGAPGNGNSWAAAISDDGRLVAFVSDAKNLVPGDANVTCDDNANGVPDNCFDVFVRDRLTGDTERVSVASDGAESVCPPSDVTQSLPHPCVFGADISGDGRYVSFDSEATNLVSNDTNGVFDVFVHDRQTGNTERSSVDSAGLQANGESGSPSISADGRLVAFWSPAGNLVSDDTNICGDPPFQEPCADIFVHDRETSETTRESVDSSGGQADGGSFYPTISADGLVVAFSSLAPSLTGAPPTQPGLVVHNRESGVTELVALDSPDPPALSQNGDTVAFTSYGAVLPEDQNNSYDVYVYDASTQSMTRVSVDSAGGETYPIVPGPSLTFTGNPSVSGDGMLVAFDSNACDLVEGDTNAAGDVFIHDLTAPSLPPEQRIPDCLPDVPSPTPTPAPTPEPPTPEPTTPGTCAGCGGDTGPVALPATGGDPAAGREAPWGAAIAVLGALALSAAGARLTLRRKRWHRAGY